MTMGREQGRDSGEILYADDYLAELSGALPPPLHSRFLEMYDYLEKVRPADALPGRQHIDPVDFPHLLALINLVDVERHRGDLSFRFRLVGTTQIAMAGRDVTGMTIDNAVVPSLASRVTANMEKVLLTARPLYDRFPMPHPNRQFIESERVYYPLAADGKTIDIFLILNGYIGPENDPAGTRLGLLQG